MSKIDEEYPDNKRWQDGTRQELIPDPGEGLQDAIDFMTLKLKQYGHKDLTFFKNEIQIEENRYYFILRKVHPKKNTLFKKPPIDKVV